MSIVLEAAAGPALAAFFDVLMRSKIEGINTRLQEIVTERVVLKLNDGAGTAVHIVLEIAAFRSTTMVSTSSCPFSAISQKTYERKARRRIEIIYHVVEDDD
ncbi:hypothetical protein CFP56_043076 [Quercus suber]|uniref:Uncharacterized protein n=1 Tax=Quercus suber TaxID=58331 RepID=A0AAW0LHI6_QUESU